MDFSKYKSSSSIWNKSEEDRQKEEEQRQKAEKVQAMFNNMATPSTRQVETKSLAELNQPLSSNLVSATNLVPKIENQPFKSSLTGQGLMTTTPINKDLGLLKKEVPATPIKNKTFATNLAEKAMPVVTTALEILDRPRNAIAAMTEAETTARNKMNFIPTQSPAEALIQGITGQKKTSFLQAGLGNKLAGQFEKSSPVIAGVGNFLGESLTDPLNILTGGAASAALKSTKLGSKIATKTENQLAKLLPGISKKVAENEIIKASKNIGNDIIMKEKNISDALKTSQLENKLYGLNKSYVAHKIPEETNFLNSNLRQVPYSQSLKNLTSPEGIKNTLQSVDNTATKPLSRLEFNKKYKLDNNLVGLTPEQSNLLARESVNKLQQDIGTRVINKLGTTDMQQIADFYKQKYNLPNIKVVEEKVKGATSTSSITPNRDLSGYTITIDPNKLSTTEHKIGVLRHEVEHAVDLANNYKPVQATRKGISSTVGQLYVQGNKGHHANYDWFEADYLYNRTNQDLGDFNSMPNIINAANTPSNIGGNTINNLPPKVDLPLSNKTITPNTSIEAVNNLSTQNIQQLPQQLQTTNNIQNATKLEPTLPKQEFIPFDQGKNLNMQQNVSNVAKKEVEPSIKSIDNVFDMNVKKETIAPKLDERGFSKNVRTDINMHDDIRQSFDENPLMKDTLSNKTTVEKAQQRYNKGFDVATNELMNTPKTLDASDVPLARMLANDAANRGDIDTARKIIANIAEKLTETGRFSQAAKILRQSDPAVFENTIIKNLTKVNEEGKKIYGNKWKDLKLDNDIVDEIYNMKYLDEKAREKVMNDIHNRLSQDIPTTNLEKFNSWRRMAMLLNPTTHIRNVVGNALVIPLRKSSDTLAAALEKAFVKEGERTKGFLWSKDKKIVNLVDNDWENVAKEDILNVQKYSTETLGSLNFDKPIFKNKKLEALNKFSMDALEAGDTPFVKRAYKDALGGYLQANKLTEVTDTAREYAKRRALEATYKQSNMFSTFMQKAKSSSKIANIGLEAIMPYTKTPSNILLQSIDYSPLGLVKAAAKAGGKKGASEVIETLAKSVVGSSVAGLGFFLGTMGSGRASAKDSTKLENLKKESGSQEYSVNTPWGSYTFDWAQPFSVPLAMGMEAANSLKGNENAIEAVWKGLAAGGDTLFNMSMLKSIKDTFGGMGSTSEKLMKAPVNYAIQAYPSMFGKIGKIADDTQRNTMGQTTLENTINQLKSKAPVLSKTLPEKRDMFGETEKTGNVVQRVAQNVISPGFAKSYNTSNLIKELEALNKKTGKVDMIPKILTQADAKDLGLNGKQMSQFQKVMGQTAVKEMNYIISTNAYKNASDEAKVSKLSSIVKDSYDTALEDFTGETKLKTKEQKAAAKVKAKEVSKMTDELKVFRKK
jgi:hypothetical protein